MAADHAMGLVTKGAALSRMDIATDLYRLSADVRRIGHGYRSDPEAIAIAKDDIAHRLAALAKELAA